MRTQVHSAAALLLLTCSLLFSGEVFGQALPSEAAIEGQSYLRALSANAESIECVDVVVSYEQLSGIDADVPVTSARRERHTLDFAEHNFLLASIADVQPPEGSDGDRQALKTVRAFYIDGPTREAWLRRDGGRPAQIRVSATDHQSFVQSALNTSGFPDLRLVGIVAFPPPYPLRSTLADYLSASFGRPDDAWDITRRIDGRLVVIVTKTIANNPDYSMRLWYLFDVDKLVPVELRYYSGHHEEYELLQSEKLVWGEVAGVYLPTEVHGERRTGAGDERDTEIYDVSLNWLVVNDRSACQRFRRQRWPRPSP